MANRACAEIDSELDRSNQALPIQCHPNPNRLQAGSYKKRGQGVIRLARPSPHCSLRLAASFYS